VNNVQTFSQSSDQYAKHRPQYPEALFSYLSELCIEHDCAWDCATGNGQAAVSSAKYFSRVEATDISQEQIAHAIPHPQVRYSTSPAEKTSFESASIDLVTVAQAVHWFDLPKFYQEVERVLKPNGILAVWAYRFLEIEPAVDKAILNDLLVPIDSFWAEGNRLVADGYQSIVLPFEEVRVTQNFSIQVDWNLKQLLDYFRTWSAVKRYITEFSEDPVNILEEKLKTLWHKPEATKQVRMPLIVKISRKRF